jgi:hypothetical protein
VLAKLILERDGGSICSRYELNNEAFIYTQIPRVDTLPNAAVQHGPIALPNLLCARSFTQKLCPRNKPANA